MCLLIKKSLIVTCVILMQSIFTSPASGHQVTYEGFADALLSDELRVVVLSPVSVNDVLVWMEEYPEVYQMYSDLIKGELGTSPHSRPFRIVHEVGQEEFRPLELIYNPMASSPDLPKFPSVPGSQWLVVLKKASDVPRKGVLLEAELATSNKYDALLYVVDQSDEFKILSAINLEWPNDLSLEHLGVHLRSDIPRDRLIGELENIRAVAKLLEGLTLIGKDNEIGEYIGLFKSKIARGIASAAIGN